MGVKKSKKLKSRYLVIAACIFLLMLPAVSYGQTFYTDFFVTLKDVNSGNIITSMPVDISWYKVDTGSTINLTKHLDKRGTFSYRISPGEWKLQVFVDNLSTPEMDYFGENTYTLEGDVVTRGEIMYVDSVGSVEIEVTDPQGNLVSGSDLNFKCGPYRRNARTDRFGTYKADNLPEGECKVFAVYSNLVGSSTVSITHGETASAEIILNEPVIRPDNNYTYIIGAGVIFAFAALFYFIGRKSKKHKKEEKKTPKKTAKKAASKKPRPKPEEEKEEGLNPRARDIMKTLKEKEVSVVNFLLENNNKSTQATIRNGTGIPKTTLARIFLALEGKKVLKIETIGKLKKIELTDWFLGKD